MKLPRCPHCNKLAASYVKMMLRVNLFEEAGASNTPGLAWLCPETLEQVDPEWVDVQPFKPENAG